jgi:hypothetical protein
LVHVLGVYYSETDAHLDLVPRGRVVLDGPPDLFNFKPVQMAQDLRSSCDGVVDGRLDALA